MKIKFAFLVILLLVMISFVSCTNAPKPPQSEDHQDTENTAEISTGTVPDQFEAVRASSEEWLSYGLLAYENDKQPQDLKDFFAIPTNMTYLTLFDHFFTYDKETSVPVAEALFRFILDEYGVEALLDIDKRLEYKSAYLKSLGLDTAYTQAPEVEALLASMDFSSDGTYKYIIAFDRVTYYFEDFDAGSPSQYHGFLYFNTTGLYDMIEYLKANNLDEGLETDRDYNFYMTFDGSGCSKTMYDTGNMYINDSSSALHEAVHAMGIHESNHIWLSEGICNYLGKALGFNDQIATGYIQLLVMAQSGYFDARADAGDETAKMYKMIFDQYTARGGKYDHVDHFDLRLYSDIVASLELDSHHSTTIGEAYELVNKKEFSFIGSELTYWQSTSLITYLVDTYGFDKVLTAHYTQDIEGNLGKPYEELKAEWLEYLT